MNKKIKNYIGIPVELDGQKIEAEGHAIARVPKTEEGPLLIDSVFGLPEPDPDYDILVNSYVFAAGARSGRADLVTPARYHQGPGRFGCPKIEKLFCF